MTLTNDENKLPHFSNHVNSKSAVVIQVAKLPVVEIAVDKIESVKPSRKAMITTENSSSQPKLIRKNDDISSSQVKIVVNKAPVKNQKQMNLKYFFKPRGQLTGNPRSDILRNAVQDGSIAQEKHTQQKSSMDKNKMSQLQIHCHNFFNTSQPTTMHNFIQVPQVGDATGSAVNTRPQVQIVLKPKENIPGFANPVLVKQIRENYIKVVHDQLYAKTLSNSFPDAATENLQSLQKPKFIEDMDLISSSRPLPKLDEVLTVYVHGKATDMKTYMDICACYDFLSRFLSLFDDGGETVSRDDFERLFGSSVKSSDMVKVLKPLFSELVSEDLPPIDELNWQALLSLVLDEEALDISREFYETDYEFIDTDKKLGAFMYIINELCETEPFETYCQDIHREFTNWSTGKMEWKKRRNQAEVELRETQEKLMTTKHDLEIQEEALDALKKTLEVEAEKYATKSIDSRMSSRQQELSWKNKKDQYLSKKEGDVTLQNTLILSVEEQIAEYEQTIEDLTNERIVLGKKLDSDAPIGLEQLRNKDMQILGYDRLGRTYWFVKMIGGLMIEDQNNHFFHVHTQAQLKELKSAMNKNGHREKTLVANLESCYEDILKSLQSTSSWRDTYLKEQSDHYPISELPQLFNQVKDSVRLYINRLFSSTRNHTASIGGINMQQLSSLSEKFEQESTLESISDIKALQQLMFDLYPLYKPYFFRIKGQCMLCELLSHNEEPDRDEESDKENQGKHDGDLVLLWQKWCLHPQSQSSFALFVFHLQKHLDFIFSHAGIKKEKTKLAEPVIKVSSESEHDVDDSRIRCSKRIKCIDRETLPSTGRRSLRRRLSRRLPRNLTRDSSESSEETHRYPLRKR